MELKTIYVVGAILVREGTILATQRGYGDYAGWWEFPGGKVEPGETPEAALAREIREELDAEIVIDRYYETTEYDYPKFHLSMRCYLCRLSGCVGVGSVGEGSVGSDSVGGAVTLLEHNSAKWVSRENVYELKWLGADLPVIEKLIADGVI